MTTDLLDQVRALKTKAKNRRDNEAYSEGIGFAKQAIELLEPAFAEAPPGSSTQTELASELADCHGVIGGILRRWGLATPEDAEQRLSRLEESVAAYDKGNAYELEEHYGVVNSYNLVNRLVGRILTGEKADLDVDLEAAKRTVVGQLLQKRRGDIWAMADLALLRILLGDWKHDEAWKDFRAKSPPEWAYESVLDTLEPLKESDLDVRDEIAASFDLLDEDLQNL